MTCLNDGEKKKIKPNFATIRFSAVNGPLK